MTPKIYFEIHFSADGFIQINSNISGIRTYVGADGKIHFVDAGGADTALNFSNTKTAQYIIQFNQYNFSYTCPHKGRLLIRRYFQGGGNPNDNTATNRLTLRGNQIAYNSNNSKYSFSYSDQYAYEVSTGDVLQCVTTNTAYTNSITAYCLIYTD